jgi:hypothetical protein
MMAARSDVSEGQNSRNSDRTIPYLFLMVPSVIAIDSTLNLLLVSRFIGPWDPGIAGCRGGLGTGAKRH